MSQSDEPARTVCRGCGNVINLEWCHCGIKISHHGQIDDHSPVPFGCDCYRSKEDLSVEEELRSRGEIG